MLPEKSSCGGIECPQASKAPGTTNRRVASGYIERFSVPGAGRNASLSALWTSPSDGYSGSPQGTRADVRPVKGVVLPILVLHAYQFMRDAINGCREKRRRGSEVTIGYPLGRWELPGGSE